MFLSSFVNKTMLFYKNREILFLSHCLENVWKVKKKKKSIFPQF